MTSWSHLMRLVRKTHFSGFLRDERDTTPPFVLTLLCVEHFWTLLGYFVEASGPSEGATVWARKF